MGKKGAKGGTSLGRALVKDRFGKKEQFSKSLRHTTELHDGQEWDRLNIQSVTEETSIDDFLSTAELAGTEFQAEKLNINFVPRNTLVGILTAEEKKFVDEVQNDNRKFLRIPRRPSWNSMTTAEELAQAERFSFLEWRRGLVTLQGVQGITMTPFEKNLEFWRQLWRVIERSDIVAQIVDARNPLLFRCEDLESYVKEINKEKDNLLIINKADFLTEEQRQTWATYFNEKNVNFVFFSALETEALNAIQEEDENESILNQSGDSNLDDTDEFIMEDIIEEVKSDLLHLNNQINKNNKCNLLENTADNIETPIIFAENVTSTPKLLNRKELINVFKTMHNGKKVNSERVTIGLVGYPNVGKSSTINSLMKEKKTSVSATPGRTKHFQTLLLSEDLMLCDCPGLVFPAFVSTKAEMVVSGILPIDQMKDHVGPVNTVASNIPRDIFEGLYGIIISKPREGEDPNRQPSAEELLNAYAFNRGFMTQKGRTDNPRASRYILKDYMNGKLLYCHAPPGINQKGYHKYDYVKKRSTANITTPLMLKTVPNLKPSDVVDNDFFAPKVCLKGVQKIGGYSSVTQEGSSVDHNDAINKPWRNKNKRNSKQKLRRKFAHLDA